MRRRASRGERAQHSARGHESAGVAKKSLGARGKRACGVLGPERKRMSGVRRRDFGRPGSRRNFLRLVPGDYFCWNTVECDRQLFALWHTCLAGGARSPTFRALAYVSGGWSAIANFLRSVMRYWWVVCDGQFPAFCHTVQ